MSRWWTAWLRPIDLRWRRLASHRKLAVALIGLLSFGLSAAVSVVRLPDPRMHDEFSYLLAADTFAHGRLANPPHPMRAHFETFHVLQEPTYASKYPPAQGLFLGLGQRLGHPIVGVWLATALAAAACCWMLQAWVPARFALWGGFFVAFHHGLQFDWQNYWNGSVAFLGGALLFGALPRLWSRPRVSAGLALAFGIALLANSRPYTGLVATVPVLGALAFRLPALLRTGSAASVCRWMLPALGVLVLTAAGMASYNAAVTGDPLKLPYQVHSERYAHTPVFLWQEPRPAPDYPNATFREFYLGWQAQGYWEQQSIWDSFRKKSKNFGFYLKPLLMVPLLMVPWMVRSRRTRFAAAMVLLVFSASLAVAGTHAHYIAPVAPLIFLLFVQGLRHLNLLRPRGSGPEPFVVYAFAAIQVAIFAVAMPLWASLPVPEWAPRRAAIRAELERLDGRHLVIVQYAEGHSPHEEWVANAADIDAAKVVWARSLGMDRDRDLLRHFADRRSWLLRPESQPVQIRELGNAAGRRRLDATPP